MGQLRTVLGTAALVLILAAGGLWYLPLEGFFSVLAKIAAGVSASLALGAVIFMLFTLFSVKEGEDLWKTGYFRYMRNIYGNAWGGQGGLLRIDTCKAVRLSAIAAMAWLFMVGLVGFLWHANISILFSNFTSFGFFPVSVNKNIMADILIFNLVGIFLGSKMVSLIGLEIESFIFRPIANKKQNTFLDICALVWLVTLIGIAVITMTAEPIIYYGIMPYLKGVGIIFGICAAIILFIFLIYLMATGIKALKPLRERTVPGRLFDSRQKQKGLKTKICPIIVQKEK